MRKVEFFYHAGRTKYAAIVEVEDDADPDEIEEQLGQWLWENTLADWRYAEEDSSG
jgi:hypothetical protein